MKKKEKLKNISDLVKEFKKSQIKTHDLSGTIYGRKNEAPDSTYCLQFDPNEIDNGLNGTVVVDDDCSDGPVASNMA